MGLSINGDAIDNVDIHGDKNATKVTAFIPAKSSRNIVECTVSLPESNYIWRTHERHELNATDRHQRVPFLPLISSAFNLKINVLLLILGSLNVSQI